MVSSGPTLVSIEVFKILIFRRAFVTFLLKLPPGIRLSRLSDPFQNQSANTPKREMINIPAPSLLYGSPPPKRSDSTSKLADWISCYSLKEKSFLRNFSWGSLLKRLWLPPLSPCSSFIFHLRSGLPLKNQTAAVVVSGKEKTEENLIFHENFIQCSTEKFSFFAQHLVGILVYL